MRRANGTGTVRKLSGNRRKPWLALTPAIMDPATGQYVRKPIDTFKTRIEAEDAANKYVQNPHTLTDITVLEMFNEWSDRHFEGLSKSTKDTYVFGFKQVKDIHKLKVRDLNPQNLQAALDKSRGKSRSTISKARLAISQICNEAMRLQIHTTDYSALLVSPPAKESKQKDIFTREDIDLMWAKEYTVPYMEIPLILIYTGMRIGELATCKLEYINLEDRYILHGSKTKSGKNRIIPIPKKIYPTIERLCKRNKEYLIEKDGQKVKSDYMRKSMYYEALSEINVTQISPHGCRRTYATMLNAGVNNKQYLTRILGHASFKTTDKYYIINQSRELVQAVDFLQ